VSIHAMLPLSRSSNVGGMISSPDYLVDGQRIGAPCYVHVS